LLPCFPHDDAPPVLVTIISKKPGRWRAPRALAVAVFVGCCPSLSLLKKFKRKRAAKPRSTFWLFFLKLLKI
jgi:hypothetical protein